jgi:phosphate transport system permease protein
MASSAANSGAVTARGPLLGQASLAIAKLLEVLFRLLCQASAVLIIVLAVLLVVVLVAKSWLAMRTLGLQFFFSTNWDTVHRQFGALAFIYGTLVTSAIAMLIAVPLGVGTAAFLSEIAPGWLRRTGSFLVEMLAAVPSVVYGFWGLFVMAPVVQMIFTWLHGPNHGGVGILSAGLILSIMIVPYIAAVSFDVCRAVPNSQRDGALALGATRWQTIRSVILPYARPGIIGGCFLALGRALGETMAVTMLIGNRPEISLSPFALGNSIASIIANEFAEATYDLYLSAVVELGCVLLLVCMLVNAAARLLIRRVTLVRPGRRFERRPPTKTAGPVAARLSSAIAPVPRVSPERARWMNQLMTGVLGFCFLITVGPLFLILGNLIYQGVGSLSWDFFVKLPAPIGDTGGGLANAIYGSFLLVALATLFAAPVGILAAIYLAEYRSKHLGPTVRFIGELLSGVPSIVIGIFAYNLIVHPIWWTSAQAAEHGKEMLDSASWSITGHFSGWAGAFALGLIMIPIVMRASEEALKLVPKSIRDASYALGASRYQTVLRVVVPAALTAITTAVFLAIARIGGETAPLLMTAFGNKFWPSSPNDFMPSLPQYIYDYARSPDDEQLRLAWAAALVLLAAVMLLNIGVRALTGKRVLLASRAE